MWGRMTLLFFSARYRTLFRIIYLYQLLSHVCMLYFLPLLMVAE